MRSVQNPVNLRRGQVFTKTPRKGRGGRDALPQGGGVQKAGAASYLLIVPSDGAGQDPPPSLGPALNLTLLRDTRGRVFCFQDFPTVST